MRWRRYGVARTTDGSVVAGATVQIYLAGTTTPVDAYESAEGGTAVNQVATDSTGTYEYFIDAADHNSSTRFKEVITAGAFNITLDNIPIVRWDPTVDQSLVGELTIQGAGNGITFPDGTRMTSTAAPGAGVTNTGDVSIAADTDADGSGEITLSTKGVPQARVPNAGGLQVNDSGSWRDVASTAFVTSRPHFKNKLINGNFDIWQRGTSFSGLPGIQYTTDRWRVSPVTYTPDVSRQELLGYDVPGSFLRVTDAGITGVAGSYLTLSQKIEDVHTFAGQVCTLSFYVRSDIAGREISLELEQLFGSGGSAAVYTAGAAKVLTTDWQKISHTFTVPSIWDKTLGAGHCLQVIVWLAGGSDHDARTGWTGGNTPADFTIDFSQIQLELGSNATDFEFRPVALEQMLCERYYRKADNANGVVATTDSVRLTGSLQPAMRAAPTILLLDTAPTVYAPYHRVGSSSALVGGSVLSSPTGWHTRVSGFSALVVGDGAVMTSTDAIALDAEL